MNIESDELIALRQKEAEQLRQYRACLEYKLKKDAERCKRSVDKQIKSSQKKHSKSYDRQLRRQIRLANMDADELKAYREKAAERKRRYKASLDAEQLKAFREKDAERKRRYRASLSYKLKKEENRRRNVEQKRSKKACSNDEGEFILGC